jgi:hypothetical protein
MPADGRRLTRSAHGMDGEFTVGRPAGRAAVAAGTHGLTGIGARSTWVLGEWSGRGAGAKGDPRTTLTHARGEVRLRRGSLTA